MFYTNMYPLKKIKISFIAKKIYTFQVHACHAKSLQSCLTLCGPIDCSHAPLSKGFSRQEYQSGLPCPPLQGIFPTQGSNPHLFTSPALVGRFFTTSATWEAPLNYIVYLFIYFFFLLIQSWYNHHHCLISETY